MVFLSSFRRLSETAAKNVLRSDAKLPTGLMGVPGLNQPEDFPVLARQAMERAESIRQETIRSVPGIDVVSLVDRLSDILCRVADTAEFCRNVHPSQSWRDQAEGVSMSLGMYIHKLNADKDLLDTVKKAYGSMEGGVGRDGWNDEAVLVTKRLIGEFQEGAGKLQGLWDKERELCFRFHANMTNPDLIRGLVISRKERGQLPRMAKKFYKTQESGQILLKATFPTISSMVALIPNEHLREKLYMHGIKSLPQNLDVLEDLIELRSEIGRGTGSKSYAHLKLKDNMVRDPAAVQHFLQKVSVNIRDMANDEYQMFSKVKGSPLQPWDAFDIAGVQEKIIEKAYVSPYMIFYLSNVLEGLARIVKEVFGVTMQELDPDPGETWCEEVRKFVLSDDNGELGTLYMDIFERKKYSGCATFTLRCGRELQDGGYQNPIVAISTRFPEGPIDYPNLKTLLHEFGHALTSLMCRSKYQHLSGTRGALDMVEVPSHFMENFARSPELLQMLCGQNCDGKLRPLDVFRLLLRAESISWGLDSQEQLVLAAADQAYFGENPPQRGELSQVFENVIGEHSCMPYVKGARESWLSHFTSYGSMYYTYLYTRCISAAVWDRHFENDPLSRESGEFVKKAMFQPGGAVDPQEYCRGLVGPDDMEVVENGLVPKIDAWLKQSTKVW